MPALCGEVGEETGAGKYFIGLYKNLRAGTEKNNYLQANNSIWNSNTPKAFPALVQGCFYHAL